MARMHTSKTAANKNLGMGPSTRILLEFFLFHPALDTMRRVGLRLLSANCLRHASLRRFAGLGFSSHSSASAQQAQSASGAPDSPGATRLASTAVGAAAAPATAPKKW